MLQSFRRRIKEKKGFTLIELVVVIAIIAVLTSVLVPSVAGYVDTARDTTAMANAKLAYTTAVALVPIWEIAERPTYDPNGSAEEQKRTYADKYNRLDNLNGGKNLAQAIAGENFLTGIDTGGIISIEYANGRVISATFAFPESRGGKSATYSASENAVIAG